jgi:hypothetical protein
VNYENAHEGGRTYAEDGEAHCEEQKARTDQRCAERDEREVPELGGREARLARGAMQKREREQDT